MQRIGFVVSPGFQVVSLSALGAFEFANASVRRPVYDVLVLSEAGGRVPSSLGLAIETKRLGNSEDERPAEAGLLDGRRKSSKRSLRGPAQESTWRSP